MVRFPALTGLRFFAAMAIVLWHSQTGYFFQIGAFKPLYLAGAVPVFFVLSGFVLTIGADRYQSWADFFVARVARVWPAHVAALAFLFAALYPYSLDSLRQAGGEGQLVLNATLLQAWSPDRATYWSYNAPSWSVSCELFLYAAFPLAFAFLRRQTLIRTAVVVIGIFGAIVAVGTIYPGIDANWLGSVNPISCFAAFAIGIATGVWRKTLPAASANGSIVQTATLALALGANIFFSAHPIPITRAARAFIFLFGPSPFYAAFILSLARYDGVISRVLSYRAIVYGGEISYSIYLFHQIIIRWHGLESASLTSVPIWLQYAGILTATLAIAAASHQFIEKPVRRAIIAGWQALHSDLPASQSPSEGR